MEGPRLGLVSLEKTPDLQFFVTLLDFATKLVKIRINKAVVGSGHGDALKYAGEGVALCRTPGTLGVLWRWFSCSTVIFRQILGGCTLDAACLKRVILFSNITSLKGDVTSYMTSQHRMCIGQVTFYYKRVCRCLGGGGSCLLFIHSSGLILSPETHAWLVPNACRSQCI